MQPVVDDPSGIQCRRIQRVGKEIVIPEIHIPPEEHVEVEPFVLINVQARNIVRIAAIAEVAETEIVEKWAMMIQRTHIDRVIKQAHAGPEIDECVVGIIIPVDFVGPVSELDGLLNVVIAGIRALCSAGGLLGARSSRQPHCRKQHEAQRDNCSVIVHDLSPTDRKLQSIQDLNRIAFPQQDIRKALMAALT